VSGYLDELQGLDSEAIAEELGFEVRRHTFACPACRAAKRGSSDSRGPVGTRRDGRGWHCHRCKATGDAIDLVAFDLCGSPFRDLRPDERAEVRAWFASRGWCEPAPERRGARAPVVPRRPPPFAPPPEPPQYPPVEQVQAFLAACYALDCDHEAVSWIKSRGLDPDTVVDRYPVRVLPPRFLLPKGTVLPPWARRGPDEPWIDTGHRLILPLYDQAGEVRSVRARAITGNAKIKALAPLNYAVRGLALACPFARTILSTAEVPAWWWEDRPLDFVFCEGEPDFLTRVSLYSDADEEAPAVIGVVAGSWSAELGARIPPRSRVALLTHADQAGDDYARRIESTLHESVIVLRPQLAEERPADGSEAA
jgi:hypothetical protein